MTYREVTVQSLVTVMSEAYHFNLNFYAELAQLFLSIL